MTPNHPGPVALYHGDVRAAHFLGDLRAIDCQSCGYCHLSPLPSEAAQEAHYERIYQASNHIHLLEQAASQQWYWRLVFKERMCEFARLVPPPVPVHYIILDWGAGCGRFTDYVEEEWPEWLPWGYEPRELAITMAKHPEFLCTDYPSQWEVTGLDAIHCSLVLEHVTQPVATLQEMWKVLRPGGILCVVVPNEFNPLQNKLRDKWDYSPLSELHVNYFTPATLQAMVEQAGFEVLRVTSTFPIEALALWGGLNYVKHPRLGQVAHGLRMAFEAALLAVVPGIKRRLYEWFAQRGTGRETELWARKLA